jgi:hypothetical protein
MREAEWLACNDLYQMLAYVLNKTGDRKLRLFGCACVRRVWPLVTEEWSRNAVQVAERYADRQANYPDLRRARLSAHVASESLGRPGSGAPEAHLQAARAAEATLQDTAWDVANNAAAAALRARHPEEPPIRRARSPEYRAQCDLLRDAFGHLFRPARLEPRWLQWHDRCVVKMAQAIYEEDRFAELPILADALEEAGCDRPDILSHCRGPLLHARGCWVVDAVLGRS